MLCKTTVNYCWEPDRRPSGPSRSPGKPLIKAISKGHSFHNLPLCQTSPWVLLGDPEPHVGVLAAMESCCSFGCVMPQCLTVTSNHRNAGQRAMQK